MTLERPYIVCDSCGHTWEAQEEEPTYCEACGRRALWAFPTLDAAEDHSQAIIDRHRRAS